MEKELLSSNWVKLIVVSKGNIGDTHRERERAPVLEIQLENHSN